MRQSRSSSFFINAAVIGLVLIWTIPTLGLFITSFRDEQAVATSGWWTFLSDLDALTLANYEEVLFGGDGLATAFLNTLAVTIPSVVIPILIAAFAAYAFAWMKFPGKRILFITVVALLVVPIQISLIPVLQAYLAIDLNGTFLAVWLAHAGFGLALATYLLYLSEEQGRSDRVALAVSKGQLASLLGTIPETLSRIFAKLSSQGLIAVEGRTIRLLDLPALEELAAAGKVS